jgi:SOS-response transcriptional repressor LexA
MRESQRHLQILEFIQNFIRERGYAPSQNEIQKACEISSKSVVHYNLEKLKCQRQIIKYAGIERGIWLNHPDDNGNPNPLREDIMSNKPIPFFPDRYYGKKKMKLTICPFCGHNSISQSSGLE